MLKGVRELSLPKSRSVPSASTLLLPPLEKGPNYTETLASMDRRRIPLGLVGFTVDLANLVEKGIPLRVFSIVFPITFCGRYPNLLRRVLIMLRLGRSSSLSSSFFSISCVRTWLAVGLMCNGGVRNVASTSGLESTMSRTSWSTNSANVYRHVW